MSDDPRPPASAMVIVAHPDDAEFMAAGTVARWAAAGAEITYVVVTRGDKGTEDPDMTPARLAAIREDEQRAAGAILGVRNFVFMGYPDGYLEHTLALRRDLTRVIRQFRPETVITFDPTTRYFGSFYLNHPDHRATGDAALDAIFPSARDRLTFPELLTEKLGPHKVREIWLGLAEAPDTVVDVSGFVDRKRAALLSHPSQMDESVADLAIGMSRAAAGGHAFEYGEAYRRIVLDQIPGAAETPVAD